jgi:hypothetical protein
VISAGSAGLAAPAVLVGCAVAALSTIAFIIVEGRLRAPMLPLEFFGRPPFRAATLVGFAISFTLYGELFVLGLFLQRLHGYPPLQTGLAFLPFCTAVGIANVAAGRAVAVVGPRLPMIVGSAIALLGAGADRPACAVRRDAAWFGGRAVRRRLCRARDDDRTAGRRRRAALRNRLGRLERYPPVGGDFEIECGGQTFTAGPGTFALLPKHLPHRFQNRSPGSGKLLCVQSPAGVERSSNTLPCLQRAVPRIRSACSRSSNDARCIRLFDPKLMSQSFAAAGGERRDRIRCAQRRKDDPRSRKCGNTRSASCFDIEATWNHRGRSAVITTNQRINEYQRRKATNTK